MNKKEKGHLGELIVKETLQSLNDYFFIINDVTLINPKSKMSHQLDHILIHPNGVFVIETKNYQDVYYDNDNKYWYRFVKNRKVKISDPLLQNKSHEITLYRLLKGQYKVTSVVVFVKNNAPYFPDDNVINLKDLVEFIMSFPSERILTKDEIDNIYFTINLNKSYLSHDQHIKNIKDYKKRKKESELEIEYVLKNKKCPICGHDIILKGYQGKCSKCGYKFAL